MCPDIWECRSQKKSLSELSGGTFHFPACLHFYLFPLSFFEKVECHEGDGRFRDGNRKECPGGPHIQPFRKKIRQRDLEKPEAYKIDDRRCFCVTCTVERLCHHHGDP